MPYKIKNISKYPVVILTPDGDKKIKHTIQPNEFEIFFYVPVMANQFHIRNIVTIEFITPNDVLPIPKVQTPQNIQINDDSDEEKNDEKLNKKRK
jgi:hypothetical protein